MTESTKSDTKPESPTTPPPPTAKSIAKEIEARRFRRKILMVIALGGAVILAVLYGTCGRGWGLGGKGSGMGGGSMKTVVAPTIDAPVGKCAVKVASTGITVEGKAATTDDTIKLCKTRGVEVLVTGGAREGDWTSLREALAAAGVEISVVEPKR